jgi:hypothetical protein
MPVFLVHYERLSVVSGALPFEARMRVGSGCVQKPASAGLVVLLGRVMFRGVGLVLLFVAILAGCAAPPPQYAKPRVSVFNGSGAVVAVVRYQSCGAGDDAWLAFDASGLAVGQGTYFEYPEGISCLNFRAISSQGKVLGTQTGVRQNTPFNWVLY